MENGDKEVKELMVKYAEKIVEAFTTLNQAISEIRRDIHIQSLTTNTKIESNNNKLDDLLNNIGEVKKGNKKVRKPSKI
jgi:stalled ribosome rescue protein Dom34